jgi:hypothetical protein
LRRDSRALPEETHNRNTLKEALQNLYPPKKQEAPEVPTKPVSPLPKKPASNNNAKEIPEDVLRGMLNVEE